MGLVGHSMSGRIGPVSTKVAATAVFNHPLRSQLLKETEDQRENIPYANEARRFHRCRQHLRKICRGNHVRGGKIR